MIISKNIRKALVSFLVLQCSAQLLLAAPPSLKKGIPNVEMEVDAEDLSIDLREYFQVHSIVEYRTNHGTFRVELFDQETPITVENFLEYVQTDAYDNSLFHRLVLDADNWVGGISILQGGGKTAETPYEDISTNAAILNEPYFSNKRGTLAMAKLSGSPNSATSQWYFNLADNSGSLDTTNGGYTVFGRVIDDDEYPLLQKLESEVINNEALETFKTFEGASIYNFGGDYTEFPLVNWDELGAFERENTLVVESIEKIRGFAGGTEGTEELSLTVTSSNPEAVSVSEEEGVLSVSVVSESGDVQSDIDVLISNGSDIELRGRFSVSVVPDKLGFESQPIGRVAMEKEDVVLSARAGSHFEVTYQWYKNGVSLGEAGQGPHLVLREVTFEDEGEYSVEIKTIVEEGEIVDSLMSNLAEVDVVDEYAKLVNISTRGYVGSIESGENMIVGAAIVEDSGDSKSVLLRASGPSLTHYFGIEGTIEDPKLLVVDPNAEDGEPFANDDWGMSEDPISLSATMERVGAFDFEEGSKDSAMQLDMNPTSFSGIFYGENGDSGIGLVECYDADADILAADARIVNLSTRAKVGIDKEVVIAGFVVDGDSFVNLLIRGVGESLAGVGGLSSEVLLDDPQIHLFSDSDGFVTSSDDWEDDVAKDSVRAIALSVGAFDLPEGSKDAAMLVRVGPGSYTVVLSGVGEGTGIGLVEVYEVKGEWTLPYEISDVNSTPRTIEREYPEFPQELIDAGILEGDVEVEWIVNADGHAELITILSSSNKAFESGVIDSLRNGLWVPGKIGTESVRTRIRQIFYFQY